MWLENPETKEIWNLMPDNPYDIEGGCALLSTKGMGYQQNVTQEQVEEDYFISDIKTANKAITGVLYFNGDKHLENFRAFVGDFRRQFTLYYSPSAEYEPYDILSGAYYKKVTISQVDKTEKDKYGWYECSVALTTQADVWKRDIYYKMGEKGYIGEALVYPYAYEYTYGGRDVYSIAITNSGRETGCIIKITNKDKKPLGKLEWYLEHKYIDDYGNEQEDPPQRSAWYLQNEKTEVILRKDYTLYVDSNPITQEAKVIYPPTESNPRENSQSVANWQEPSWDYINFVRIKNGDNKLVFYVEHSGVEIEVIYQEQKEII